MENSWISKCFLVCRPIIGRRSAGGQKKRWCDVLATDLKWCDLRDDGMEIAKDIGACRSLVGRQHQTLMITRKHMRRRIIMGRRREEWTVLNQQHWTRSVKSLGVFLVDRQKQDWSTMSGRGMAVWSW